MRFLELKIKDKFISPTYPECVGTKLKKFPGSCCTPPHNAALVCNGEEKLVEFNNQDVVEPFFPAQQEGLAVEKNVVGFKKLEVPEKIKHDNL